LAVPQRTEVDVTIWQTPGAIIDAATREPLGLTEHPRQLPALSFIDAEVMEVTDR
jgi:hypothetical protein